jgi:hypothetical protein
VTGPKTRLLWLLPLLVAAPARATESVDIELAYEAPAECPDRAELERQIQARSSRIRFAAGKEFRVRVTRGWQADIQVESTTREVNGETCREVVTAAALIIAVLADPDAPPPSEPLPPAPAPLPPPAPTRRPPEEPEPTPPSEPWPWRFALGMGLSVDTAPAPDPIFSPRPFVAFERAPHTLAVRPTARLSLARGSSGSITTDSGTAELVWTAGRLDACAAFGDDDGLGFEPCATFELGAIRARGFRTQDGAEETVIWLAGGFLGRASYGLGSLFRFELQGGLAFPTRRYRFFFGPDETAHKVPAVGVTAGVGIAVLLP